MYQKKVFHFKKILAATQHLKNNLKNKKNTKWPKEKAIAPSLATEHFRTETPYINCTQCGIMRNQV